MVALFSSSVPFDMRLGASFRDIPRHLPVPRGLFPKRFAVLAMYPPMLRTLWHPDSKHFVHYYWTARGAKGHGLWSIYTVFEYKRIGPSWGWEHCFGWRPLDGSWEWVLGGQKYGGPPWRESGT